MSSRPVRPPLPPMPAWLRVLGVAVCLLPLIVLVVSFTRGSQSWQEALGGLLFLGILFGPFLALFLVPGLLVLLFWLLGWRPGALAGSVWLGLCGVGFSTGQTSSDWHLGLPLDLHFLLIGVLLWEWRRARARQRQVTVGPVQP